MSVRNCSAVGVKCGIFVFVDESVLKFGSLSNLRLLIETWIINIWKWISLIAGHKNVFNVWKVPIKCKGFDLNRLQFWSEVFLLLRVVNEYCTCRIKNGL